MTQQMLSAEEIANVLTYVYNSWGNSGQVVTKAMVDKVKNKK
jgi:nitrite reductase (NO-forming)